MSATSFKSLNARDTQLTRTKLHESIPVTGTILSGTYNEENIKNYSHGMFQSVYDYPYLSSSANHIFDITMGYSSNSDLSSSSNTTQRRLASSVVCRLSSSGAAFFPRFFFARPSLHLDKNPPKQGPYSCCSGPMIELRGLWLGALRGPLPVQPMKTRGLWPMTTLRGLWPGAVTPRGLWLIVKL